MVKQNIFARLKNPLEQFKYEKYGITHCIVFNSYNEIYECLYEAGQEAEKISVNDLDEYKHFSIIQLADDYESNKPYLFFGKSLISKDHAISIPISLSQEKLQLLFLIIFQLAHFNLLLVLGVVENPMSLLILHVG